MPRNLRPRLADTSVFDDTLVSDKEIVSALRIGLTQWWCGVRDGIYPQPVRLGSRTTRWRKSDIDRLIARGLSAS